MQVYKGGCPVSRMIKDNPKTHHCIGKDPKSPVCAALGKPAWTLALVATASQGVCQTSDFWPSCCRGWLCNSLIESCNGSQGSHVSRGDFWWLQFCGVPVNNWFTFPALKQMLLHTGVPQSWPPGVLMSWKILPRRFCSFIDFSSSPLSFAKGLAKFFKATSSRAEKSRRCPVFCVLSSFLALPKQKTSVPNSGPTTFIYCCTCDKSSSLWPTCLWFSLLTTKKKI